MNKFNYLLLLLMTVAINVVGQNGNPSRADEKFTSDTYESFLNYYQAGINEKLYIQTDKPYYSAGEDIWLKGYLINSITHEPIEISNYIYVELIDQRDSLFTRIKIKADEYGFHNSITLPNDMVEGDYTLRAYTQWMRNWDDDYFFHRKIHIVNPIDDDLKISASYTPEPDGGVTVKLSFKTLNHINAINRKIEYAYKQDGKTKLNIDRVGEDGSVTIKLPSNLSAPDLQITSLSSDLPFSKIVYVPLLSDKLDVQFFPEGGSLLAGVFQKIVFKAVGSDGLSREVKGKIVNERGDVLSEIHSEFKGMGQFSLMAQMGEKYYAVMQDVDFPDVEVRAELPAAVDSGCIIQARMTRDALVYQAVATSDVDLSKIALVIHSRGQVVSSQMISSTPQSKQIPLSMLPEGIVSIAVVDLADNTPIAERLVFIPVKDTKTNIVADKANYSRRSLVNLELNVEDEFGPVAGDFSVAVTDRHSVDVEQLEDNIVSNLLLNSDLQGQVEAPADYFTENPMVDMVNRDMLMLTQGWRRFSLGDILKDNIAMPQLVPEDSFMVSGEIKGFFGNKVKNANIIIFNSSNKSIDMQPVAGSNKFDLSGIDYPDSTSLMLQAVTKNGSSSKMTLNVNPETFPGLKYRYTLPLIGREKVFVPDNYLSQSKEKYFTEGGIRVINMEEISLTVEKSYKESNIFNITPSHSLSEDNLENNSHLTVFEALRLFPGVTISEEGEMRVRGSYGLPLVYLDDMVTDFEFVRTIPLSQVESLDLMTGPEASIFGSVASCVVLVKLKVGASLADAIPPSPSLFTVNYLGYKKPSEMYQPRYQTPAEQQSKKSDLRTTIHWDPRIKTDASGEASISFYTADRTSVYDVIVEGISKEGKVIRYETTIERQ